MSITFFDGLVYTSMCINVNEIFEYAVAGYEYADVLLFMFITMMQSVHSYFIFSYML